MCVCVCVCTCVRACVCDISSSTYYKIFSFADDTSLLIINLSYLIGEAGVSTYFIYERLFVHYTSESFSLLLYRIRCIRLVRIGS